MKRKYIAMEVLQTEESYVASLKRVIDHYLDPMMKKVSSESHESL